MSTAPFKVQPPTDPVKANGPVPLLDAFICLDCDVIFPGPACPICASDKSFPISRWLNRPCPCTAETAATLNQLGNYCQTCATAPERKAP